MAKAVIKGYANAVWKGELGEARKYLADTGFTFEGTLASYGGDDAADKVIENVTAFRQMVEEVTFFREVFDENSGFILYDVVTKSPAGTVRMAEYCEVADGRIVAMKLVFDASAMRKNGGKSGLVAQFEKPTSKDTTPWIAILRKNLTRIRIHPGTTGCTTKFVGTTKDASKRTYHL